MDFKYGTIIKNSSIPERLSFFINIKGITLWPYIILDDEGDSLIINHERIHIAQQRELFVILFYVLYVTFWIYYLFKFRKCKDRSLLAYRSIPFEREAYINTSDYSYLLKRSPYSWIKYVKL